MSLFVEPLDTEKDRFRSSVQETASARSTQITATGTPEVLSWAGWTLSMPTCVLLNTTASRNVPPGTSWALKEVVYIMMPLAEAYPYDTDVHSVVLIFRRTNGPSVAVRVLKATFIAKFQAPILANAAGVLFATIPDNQMSDSVAPLAASAISLPLAFPNIAVTFGAVVFGARANTAISPLVHHIAHVTASNTGTMYFGMVGHPLMNPNHTKLKYGGKHLWPASPQEQTFASATLTLVVGPTLASDGFVDHDTLAPGKEVELTQVSTSTQNTMPTAPPCFVSAEPTISFCPYTGTLTYGGNEYTLAEVLYVPDLIGGRPARGAVDIKWAYVLNFRSTSVRKPLPFALRLGPENADMLIKVVGMHSKPVAATAPTSTAIHANSKVALLPPWPNAHSQATSTTAAVRALPTRPATAPPVAPSLMPLNRARMIHYPAFEYFPAAPNGQFTAQVQVTALSVVVRYEPIPTCEDYKDRTKNWDMWPLCAADASARAGSPACGVFKSCLPTTPGTPAASLIDARGSFAVTVPLYQSAESRVLYGLTATAVYVVRPAYTAPAVLALDDWSGPSDVTHVVIATETSTERLTATKYSAADSAAAGANPGSSVYRIAAGQPGQQALPCASLVTCMKGTDLASCSSSSMLSVTCALTEDRSPVVATLEYSSSSSVDPPVSLRQLDADVLFGVDLRGAFALHKTTGSVLYTPGVEWPAWPSVSPQAGTPMVLKATLDSTTKVWRVGGAASSKASLMPLWITLGVVGGLAVIVMIIVVVSRSRRR